MNEMFVKLRADAAHVEQTMDLVEKTLSKPERVFQLTKSWRAENIMKEELTECNNTLDDMKELTDIATSNAGKISEFLSSVNDYIHTINSGLKDIESQLTQYGYQGKECDTPVDQQVSIESGIECLSLETPYDKQPNNNGGSIMVDSMNSEDSFLNFDEETQRKLRFSN